MTTNDYESKIADVLTGYVDEYLPVYSRPLFRVVSIEPDLDPGYRYSSYTYEDATHGWRITYSDGRSDLISADSIEAANLLRYSAEHWPA